MERVTSNGVTLAVREWAGTGLPVVAIHGLTANHTCWEPVARALAPRHRVIAYDLRGRGDSDKPETGYDLGTHAADLLDLLDARGVTQAVVAGHSLGAGIALRFAVTHPERVAKLALIDGGLDVRPEVLDSLAPALRRLDTEVPSLAEYLERLRGLPMFAGRWNAALERYFTYDVEAGPGGGVRSKVPRRVVEAELAALARTRLWVLHHRVTAPTLLIRAPDGLLTRDDCLMTQEEAEAMAHAIPTCRLVVAPGTNHYTVLLAENPLAARDLSAFLGD